MRPELLAVRAVNQYRNRDVLAYLGLRYYLENIFTLSNAWVRNVSTHLVDTRTSPVYFRSYHFKKTDGDSIVHRSIFVPGPNEALAETALLYECSKYPAFNSLKNVYSYKFPSLKSKSGVFQTYFSGFKGRHKSIASACQSLNGATVQYTDIQNFYPSISKELALQKWRSACDSSSISAIYRELGEKILEEHSKAAIANNEGVGLLVGPMFSHLIANLVLGEVDEIMMEKMDGKYWRYVDDIVLVGNQTQVDGGREFLSSTLNDMGLILHEEGKDFAVDTSTWLKGAQDFDNPDGKVWISLVANIKRFLIMKPDERSELASAFSENEINIPLLDYLNIVSEASYLERLSDWLKKYSWGADAIKNITVQSLVEEAIYTRQFYSNKINFLFEISSEMQGYARKRLIPKLRFYSGRLIFLASPDLLSSLSSALSDYPELFLQSKVLDAILSRDVSSLLSLGSNAVQAAAQVLRMKDSSVICSLATFEEVDLQGIAILRLNGINVDFSENTEVETTMIPLQQPRIKKRNF